jgi:hypothetical protein
MPLTSFYVYQYVLTTPISTTTAATNKYAYAVASSCSRLQKEKENFITAGGYVI